MSGVWNVLFHPWRSSRLIDGLRAEAELATESACQWEEYAGRTDRDLSSLRSELEASRNALRQAATRISELEGFCSELNMRLRDESEMTAALKEFEADVKRFEEQKRGYERQISNLRLKLHDARMRLLDAGSCELDDGDRTAPIDMRQSPLRRAPRDDTDWLQPLPDNL